MVGRAAGERLRDAGQLPRPTGRQYVVIAAGGGNKYDKTFSGKIVAFALPRKK